MRLALLDRPGLDRAQQCVTERHYLRKPVDVRCMPEAYGVMIDRFEAGFMIVGRPQATKCYPWYGSVEDVASGRAECTRWQVLNLARIWLSPMANQGGYLAVKDWVPGFTDRKGEFRSTLGSTAIHALADRVVLDYLVRRPPCFLEEPYALRWLLSYCDTRVHQGTLYRAAGFELYRTNDDGIQTWRLPLRALTTTEDAAVRQMSGAHPRSQEHRARRAQLELAGV